MERLTAYSENPLRTIRHSPTMFLSVSNLKKSFGDEPVLRGVSFILEGQETMTVLGRSGSGKTTLLKIIAGLEVEDEGEMVLDGEDLTGRPPQQRGVVYLYQEPLLFPHLNVFENIAFGLRLQKEAEEVLARRTREMIASLELEEHASKMPHQLSGGQRQRVAFGRAIIVNPKLLLLDEPFGSLDVEIRAGMQDLFKRLAKQFEITSLFVTHDLKEAILVGDRIAAMRDGSMVTYASKQAFIDDPAVGVQREWAFWDGLKPGT